MQKELTSKQAQILAIALEKAREGKSATKVVEMAMFNLGMRPYGEVGEKVSHTGLKYQDTEGGIWPGDPVIILERGWSLDGKPVIKAPVRSA